MIRYDTIRDAILTCAQKLTSQLNLPHGTKFEKVKREKQKKYKTDMLRSIGKQSEESVESVLKKKREVTVGIICRKEGFKPGMKE